MGWFSDFFDSLVRILTGKKISVLGERGVGKTVFLSFLHTGVFSNDYEQTLGVTKVKARSFELRDLKLHLKKGADVPGEADFYESFKKLYAESDFCIHLLHAGKIISNDKDARVRSLQDADNFREWKKQIGGKSTPPIYILITHADTISGFDELTAKTRGQFEDKIRGSQIVSEFCKIAQIPASHVVVGSLKTQESMETAVYRLFKAVLNI